MRSRSWLVLLAAIVIPALPSNLRAQVPAAPPPERALAVAPDILAAAYVKDHTLLDSLKIAKRAGTSVHAVVDGFESTVDSSNVDVWIKGITKRIDTYTTAIQKRGFGKIAGSYTIKGGDSCLFVGSKRARLVQTGFMLTLEKGTPDSTHTAHHGVIVQSTVVIEDSRAPGRLLVGTAANGTIELTESKSPCRILMTATSP